MHVYIFCSEKRRHWRRAARRWRQKHHLALMTRRRCSSMVNPIQWSSTKTVLSSDNTWTAAVAVALTCKHKWLPSFNGFLLARSTTHHNFQAQSQHDKSRIFLPFFQANTPNPSIPPPDKISLPVHRHLLGSFLSGGWPVKVRLWFCFRFAQLRHIEHGWPDFVPIFVCQCSCTDLYKIWRPSLNYVFKETAIFSTF